MNRNILLSGLPGSMAHETLLELMEGPDSERILPVALSSDARNDEHHETSLRKLKLVGPSSWSDLKLDDPAIAIDFSIPQAVLPNAIWFCERGIPFVMGTTSGDEEALREVVSASSICAVVAPNMGAPVVLIQHAIAYLAHEFPNALADHNLRIEESHQAGKRDTSGTAKAILAMLNKLGLPGEVNDIQKNREPEKQRQFGVPEQHLAGHAYHDYQVSSWDGSMTIGLQHNVNGRRVYARGAVMAARFLEKQIEAGERGRVFSMSDVLRG